MSFKCGYCGREYKSPVERANCEIACETINRKKAEQERIKKLQVEKQDRLNEIQKYLNIATEKIKSFNKDYNESVFLLKDYNDYDNLFNLLRNNFGIM